MKKHDVTFKEMQQHIANKKAEITKNNPKIHNTNTPKLEIHKVEIQEPKKENTNIETRTIVKNNKVMICEKMLCHFECLPTWTYLFNQLGATVYISQSRGGNNQNMIPLMKQWISPKIKVLKKFKSQNFDIVINNSLYPHRNVENLNTKQKTFSVLHRFGKFNDKRATTHPKHYIISLAPHVHERVKALTPRSLCLLPIYFGPVKNINVTPEAYKTVKFIIQGNIEFKRRNYKSVFGVAKHCIANGHKNFKIVIMGRGNKSKLQSWITPVLKGKIQIINGAGYKRYFDEIRSSHWLLPLIDGTYKHQYFTHKLSSSLSMAIGNKVPLILHHKLSNIYDLKTEVNSLEYGTLDQFKNQVVKALKMTNTEYQKYRDGMSKVYDGWMDKNKSSLSNIIK